MKSNKEVLRKEIGMIKDKLQDEEERTQKLSSDLKQLENEVNNLKVDIVMETIRSLVLEFETK